MSQIGIIQLTVEEIRIEESWINNAQKNPKGFEPLYNRYYEAILGFIYKRIFAS